MRASVRTPRLAHAPGPTAGVGEAGVCLVDSALNPGSTAVRRGRASPSPAARAQPHASRHARRRPRDVQGAQIAWSTREITPARPRGRSQLPPQRAATQHPAASGARPPRASPRTSGCGSAERRGAARVAQREPPPASPRPRGVRRTEHQAGSTSVSEGRWGRRCTCRAPRPRRAGRRAPVDRAHRGSNKPGATQAHAGWQPLLFA